MMRVGERKSEEVEVELSFVSFAAAIENERERMFFSCFFFSSLALLSRLSTRSLSRARSQAQRTLAVTAPTV